MAHFLTNKKNVKYSSLLALLTSKVLLAGFVPVIFLYFLVIFVNVNIASILNLFSTLLNMHESSCMRL